jgi:hypothetical protein
MDYDLRSLSWSGIPGGTNGETELLSLDDRHVRLYDQSHLSEERLE